MKLRRTLYLWSGILNCVAGVIASLLGVLVLLLGKLIRAMFDAQYEIIEEFIKEVAKADSEYAYLLDLSKEEAIAFVMGIANTFFVALLIVGIVAIILGVINVKLRHSHDRVFAGKTAKKWLLVIVTWVVTGINFISAIATTVAVFMKVKDDERNKLYVSTDSVS